MQDNNRYVGTSKKGKCPLFDSADERHDQEVRDAYQKALSDYKRNHPDVEVGKDLNIDLPGMPLEALERAVADAEAVAQRASDARASALTAKLGADDKEDALQARVSGSQAGSSRGIGGKKMGALFRLRGLSAEVKMAGLMRQLSAAKNARVTAERRLHDAEESVQQAEERLAELRRQLEEKRK